MNRLIAIVIVSVFVLSCNKAPDSSTPTTQTVETPNTNTDKESTNPLLGKWTYTSGKDLVHSYNSYYIWHDYLMEFQSDNTATIKIIENKQVYGETTVYKKIAKFSSPFVAENGVLKLLDFTSQDSCSVSKGQFTYTIGSYSQMLYLKVPSQNWSFDMGRTTQTPSAFTSTTVPFSTCPF